MAFHKPKPRSETTSEHEAQLFEITPCASPNRGGTHVITMRRDDRSGPYLVGTGRGKVEEGSKEGRQGRGRIGGGGGGRGRKRKEKEGEGRRRKEEDEEDETKGNQAGVGGLCPA